jgi:AcrR family transcriptional regulator
MAKPSLKANASPPERKRGRKAVRLPEAGEADAIQLPAAEGRRRRGDDVRERILGAALQCFSAFGFEGTSTRAVAEKAGLTHSLILYHFESKDQLWISTMEAVFGTFVGKLRAVIGENEGPADKALREFIASFVRLAAEHPEINRIMTMEGGQDTERLRYVMDAHGKQIFNEVCSLMRRGQEEGTVRDCDPARMYFHIVASGESVFSKAPQYKQLTGRDAFSEQEILRTTAFLYDVVFRTD